MASQTTTALKTDPPQWLLDIYDDIDTNRFGAAFDVLSEDVEVHFGINNWVGRDAARTKLRQLNGEMKTKHHIDDYWDLGLVKVFIGNIDITDPETGNTVNSVFTHVWRMSSDDPDTVAVVRGSVGPMDSLR